MKSKQIDTILAPVSGQEEARREEQVRSEFWPKFKAFAARLPFAEEVAAGYYCAMDRKTPFKVRGTLLAALAYFILPLDIVPDFLAIIGLSDDIAVLTTAFLMVRDHITEEHREQARRFLAEDAESVDVS